MGPMPSADRASLLAENEVTEGAAAEQQERPSEDARGEEAAPPGWCTAVHSAPRMAIRLASFAMA